MDQTTTSQEEDVGQFRTSAPDSSRRPDSSRIGAGSAGVVRRTSRGTSRGPQEYVVKQLTPQEARELGHLPWMQQCEAQLTGTQSPALLLCPGSSQGEDVNSLFHNSSCSSISLSSDECDIRGRLSQQLLVKLPERVFEVKPPERSQSAYTSNDRSERFGDVMIRTGDEVRKEVQRAGSATDTAMGLATRHASYHGPVSTSPGVSVKRPVCGSRAGNAMASVTAPSTSGTSAAALSPNVPMQPHLCNPQQVVSPPHFLDPGAGGTAAPPTPAAPVAGAGLFVDVHAAGGRTSQQPQIRKRVPSTCPSPAKFPLSPRAQGHIHLGGPGLLQKPAGAAAPPSQHFTPRTQQQQSMATHCSPFCSPRLSLTSNTPRRSVVGTSPCQIAPQRTTGQTPKKRQSFAPAVPRVAVAPPRWSLG